MADMTQEEKDRIIHTLEMKGATKPCPRCGNSSFTLINGYFSHFIQPQLSGITIGGPSIPTTSVVCTNCGWLSEHALGALGLLVEKKESDPKERP